MLTITGKSVVSLENIVGFIKKNNPNFDENIAKEFLNVGEVYNIRGDVAICQSIIETGWFKYVGGTAVTPDQHNYCGLGVTSLGLKGNSFETIKDGVTAQMQHLLAYANNDDIPSGEKLIDPRFKYVTRGSANNSWEGLSRKWSSSATYGVDIIALYSKLLQYNQENKPSQPAIKESFIKADEFKTIQTLNVFLASKKTEDIFSVEVARDRDDFRYIVFHKNFK
ncbi:endolysin [Bacillus phage vB_BanS_Sophrita]|uniref:Glucosaminidase domain-containing protein n=1 Tax=Bacillus phage vB_BanS_Sophrita TaxID=2894790 RepID=A0AAE9CDJ2_9CAUD|nr:endolysin [Bacillus phage vB_BanS_Sophrita]UGO50820.1 glucosaminidase domain-containing protein [Bacillus phage vB_BanS_Sophrita]